MSRCSEDCTDGLRMQQKRHVMDLQNILLWMEAPLSDVSAAKSV